MSKKKLKMLRIIFYPSIIENSKPVESIVCTTTSIPAHSLEFKNHTPLPLLSIETLVRINPQKCFKEIIISFVTQEQKRKYVYITADSEHGFDLSGLISAVGVQRLTSVAYIGSLA